MPVTAASSSAARPLGAAPITGTPGRLVGLVEDAEGGGLAGAGDADDADDPVGSQGGLADERPLLAGETGLR